ncbi:unnamed protein product, partial [Prorocentrum cordatum]
ARAAREPAATMAPGRASRGSSGGGGSCLRPALFAWFLALAALVVYANFSYTPQSSLRPAESSSEEDAAPRPQEAAAGPVLAAAAGPTEVLAKAAPAEAAPGRAFRGQPLPAASPGPPPPAVAPSGAAQASRGAAAALVSSRCERIAADGCFQRFPEAIAISGCFPAAAPRRER